jgi:hypothetical protein
MACENPRYNTSVLTSVCGEKKRKKKKRVSVKVKGPGGPEKPLGQPVWAGKRGKEGRTRGNESRKGAETGERKGEHPKEVGETKPHKKTYGKRKTEERIEKSQTKLNPENPKRTGTNKANITYLKPKREK